MRPADLVTFTKEILNEKLQFLRSDEFTKLRFHAKIQIFIRMLP